jgi:N utilization substance protein A
MSREILLLVDALAREKNVSKEIVFSALESALAQATKKRINDEADVRVSIDRETGDYESFRRWQVLPDEDVENDEAQMGLIDAREEYPDIQVGDYVEEGLEPIDFGRIGAQAAKQVILQKVRDAEREQILNDFLERKEYIISGSHQAHGAGQCDHRSGAPGSCAAPRPDDSEGKSARWRSRQGLSAAH